MKYVLSNQVHIVTWLGHWCICTRVHTFFEIAFSLEAATWEWLMPQWRMNTMNGLFKITLAALFCSTCKLDIRVILCLSPQTRPSLWLTFPVRCSIWSVHVKSEDICIPRYSKLQTLLLVWWEIKFCFITITMGLFLDLSTDIMEFYCWVMSLDKGISLEKLVWACWDLLLLENVI